jgi:hypothetical protein
MIRRSHDDDQSNNLDRYADADEATIRRHPSSEAELDEYDEDDVTTAPLLPRS